MQRWWIGLALAACSQGGVAGPVPSSLPAAFALDAAEVMRLPQHALAMAARDYDGDGLDDAAFVYDSGPVPDGSERLLVLLRQADGGWRQHLDVPERFAATVLAGDFDGDGRDEVLSIGERAALYDGSGELRTAVDLPWGDAPAWGAELADFDADGLPDVAVATPEGIGLLRTQAGGLAIGELLPFDPGRPASAPAAGTGVTSGDLDGDGWPDLVAWSHDDGRVRSFHNLGRGFAAWHDLDGDGKPIGDLVVGDAAGDSAPDLLLASVTDGGIAILKGDGQGGFAAAARLFNGRPVFGLSAADLGGARWAVSLASDNAVVLLARQGDQVVETARYGTGPNPTRIDSGDFAADGTRDLIVLNIGVSRFESASTFNVLHGRGDGTLRAAPARLLEADQASRLAIADLDGDSLPEVVLGSDRYRILTVLGKDGVLRNVGHIFGLGMALGHISGGSGWDLAATIGEDTKLRWAPGFTALDTLELRAKELKVNGEEIALADLDGDGRDELLLSSYGTNQLVIVTDPVGAPRKKLLAVAGPGRLATGDLDGDGSAEIVLTNDAGDALLISPNGPDGPVVVRTLAAGLARRAPVALADLDGDGRVDLAAADTVNGELAIYFGSGDGTVGPPRIWSAGGGPLSLAIADLDGDGMKEILMGTWYNLITVRRARP